MNISVSSLLANLIFGIIGLAILREGKKRAQIKLIVIGVLLMAYPYFTSGPLLDWGIGIALCGWAYLEIRG